MKLIWEHLWTCIPSYSKYHVHEGVHDWKHMLPQCVEIIFCYFNTYNKKNSYPFYFFRILNFPYSYAYTHSLTQLSLSLYYCHILSNKPCKLSDLPQQSHVFHNWYTNHFWGSSYLLNFKKKYLILFCEINVKSNFVI